VIIEAELNTGLPLDWNSRHWYKQPTQLEKWIWGQYTI